MTLKGGCKYYSNLQACKFNEKVQVSKDQEKAQSEKNTSHSKNRGEVSLIAMHIHLCYFISVLNMNIKAMIYTKYKICVRSKTVYTNLQ